MKVLLARIALTSLAVWPTVTAQLLAVSHISPDIPLLGQTLLLTALFVPLSVIVIAPRINRLIARRFDPSSRAIPKSSGDIAGG
jgi:hypothetical protein